MNKYIVRIRYFGDKLETNFSEIESKYENLNKERKEELQEELEELKDEIRNCWLESEGILTEINKLEDKMNKYNVLIELENIKFYLWIVIIANSVNLGLKLYKLIF